MAGGPSTPALTAAVAGAGGYGFLAAGYRSPDDLRGLISTTRSLTGAPFGVNIFCPSVPADPGPVRAYARTLLPESDRLGVALGEPAWDDDGYHSKVEIVASAGVDLVSFTFGCPTADAIDGLHSAGCRVAVTVTSVGEAAVAERAGADLLAVQGTEAGGHQGSFLDLTPNIRPLLSLLVWEPSVYSWAPHSCAHPRPEPRPPTGRPCWAGPIPTPWSPGRSADGTPAGWPTSSPSGTDRRPRRPIPRCTI